MKQARLTVDGRFFSCEGERVVLRGVTLGPFPEGKALTAELAEIADSGANMVRVYETPDLEFLDEAARLGIQVFASVPWDWEYDFVSHRRLFEKGYLQLRAFLKEFGSHPALAAVYIANEIRAELVHEMGKNRVKEDLEELIYRLREDCDAVLYGYANYPTTEFLELENADFSAFNVYLEEEKALRDYLQHLQIVAGDRPLVISEFGADVNTHSEAGQADLLKMGLRAALNEGVQGFTIFSWSDVWWNNGEIVEGWKFGLTDVDGKGRLSIDCLKLLESDALDEEFFSVVVCSYNGADRIEGTLEALLNQRDQNYEVIVVNDGSQDETAEVAMAYVDQFAERKVSLRVHTQKNEGLSFARNKGAELGKGSVIAYTDDDARPDRDWIKWLRVGFREEEVGMVGGYGLPPERIDPEANEVSRLPGQACPVLVDNKNAEHLPGCNMAVRRSAWEEVEGFRAQYRVAGDDVDFCWRVIAAGYAVHFHPCAIVWHESRATYEAYLKQQWGYGKAEALLLKDHPERFSKCKIEWSGEVYSGMPRMMTTESVIYSGGDNQALFQPIVSGVRSSQATTLRGKILERSYLLIRAVARRVYRT